MSEIEGTERERERDSAVREIEGRNSSRVAVVVGSHNITQYIAAKQHS